MDRAAAYMQLLCLLTLWGDPIADDLIERGLLSDPEDQDMFAHWLQQFTKDLAYLASTPHPAPQAIARSRGNFDFSISED